MALARAVPRACRAFSTSAAAPAADTLKERLTTGLGEMREAGTYKKERVIVTPQGTSVRVEGREEPVDVFCANNVRPTIAAALATRLCALACASLLAALQA